MAIISLDEYMAQQKKKKKNVITLEEYMESQGLSPTVATDDDIAPVKETKKTSGKEEKGGQKNSYLQKGALEDGITVGNAVKGARATKKDVYANALKGILGGFERAWDTVMTMGSGMAQNQAMINQKNQILHDVWTGKEVDEETAWDSTFEFQQESREDNREYVAKDIIKEEKIAHEIYIAPFEEQTGINVEESSFLGAKGDELVQSASEMLVRMGVDRIAPGAGLGLTFLSSTGGELEEGFRNENATYGEVVLSGFMTGVSETASEQVFGGIKFGGKSITDEVVEGIAKNIPNKLFATLTKWGFDVTGEGLEEVLSYLGQSIGQKLTYLSEEEFNEIFTSEEAWENFVAGSIMGGVIGGGNAINSTVNPNAKDFVTGKSKDEQKVFDSIYEEAIANKEAEKGSKLTAKEKRELYNEIENSITKGYVSTDVIERVLGGKTYETYKQALDDENALKTEKDKLSSYKKRTNVQEQKLAEINERLGNSTTGDLKVQLSNEVFKRAKGTGLEESYRNLIRKGQKFEADLDSYTEENVKQTVKNFMDEYGGNNSNESHDFLDFCINLIKGRDTVYRFMTTKQIEESIKNGNQYELREDIAPSRFQGFLHTGTNEIIINMDSGASFKSVIGHEITHTFDELGLESYNEMQKALFDYVGEEELARRREAKKGLYAEEQIDREVTADLVGEYITSDEKFVKQLAVENPNLFQRFLEGIKRLYKMATAGSEQARELERAKKMYEKAWRESQSANKNVATENAGTKNSISTEVDNVSDRLSASEWKRVQSAVAERKKLNYHYEKSSDGDIIIPINNKLVYTDANFDSPGISKVVEFDTEYEDEIDNARRLIYEAEKNKSEISDAYEVIEIFAGYEFINEYTQKGSESVKGYDRRTSRGKSKSDAYHANFMQEQNRRAREIIHSVNGETSSEDGVFFDAENQSDARYSIADNDYLDAVNKGDTETAQKMVDETAKKAGYTIRAYHGTNALFNVFDTGLLGSKNFMASSAYKGFFASKSRGTAENYTGLNSSDTASLYLNKDAQAEMEKIKAKHNFDKAKFEYDNAKDLFVEEYKNAHGYKEAVTDIVDSLAKMFPDKSDAIERIRESYEFDWYSEKTDNGLNNANRLHKEFSETEASKKFEELNSRIYEEWEQTEIKRKGYVPNVKNLYLKITNPLIHDFKNEGRDVDFTDLIDEAKKNGNDGCIFKNVQDGADFDDIYVVFDNTQLKSADAVTYDKDGNVIPLSQRFNKDNDDIRYSIADSDSEGRQLSKGQKEYFAQSKAVDRNGNLVKVHHGTVREFYTFDREYANPEGDMGKGFYFTSDAHDVERNYANFDGADLKNKIEREADLLEGEEAYQDVSHDEIVEALREKYITVEEPMTLECYLNITNPVYVGENETYLLDDINENYDVDDFESEEEYHDAIDQILYDTVEEVMHHINNNIDLWSDTREIESILYESALEGGITLSALKKRLNDAYIEGENGNLVANEVARLIVEALGYDGIIDTSVSEKFSNIELNNDTVHYIVFDSSQAKLVTNENPTSSKDTRYRIDDGYSFGKDSSPYTAENLKLRNQQDDIAPIIGWDASGSDTALDGGSQREHISLEEYANSDSPVWRNVEYNDVETKNTIMLETHKEMVASGEIVVVSDEVVNTVDKSYPDLRSMKKKDRNPILGEAIRKLKTDIQQFLGKFTEQKFEFEVNGKILDAKLYNTGIKEVVEKVTREKASMLYSTEEIFRNAQYLYSTRDYSDDTNVYRWNYFYTPVEINGQIVGVRIAVRDMVQGTNEMPESQIYNWGIKKDTSLDGGSPSPKVTSSDVSSDVSNNIIPQDTENTSDIFDDDFPIRDDIKQNRVDETPIEVQTVEAPIREDFSTEQVAPVKDDSNNASQKQRKWVGTSTESDVVDGKVAIEDLDQDIIHYQPIPNSRTLGNANAKLESMGYDEALQYFNSQFHNRKVSLDDVALGERLLQEAVRKGDTETAHSLIQNISILGTELGQKVQALSIIKKAKPEGQLRMLEKIVERGKTKGDKVFDGVEVTKEMREHILSVYGKDGSYKQEDLDRAVEEVKQQIADQMGVTKLEKVNAWRMLSMLGNPKTHIRNLVSNVAMRGTLSVKNAIARTIETFAPIKNRTKTWKKPTDVVKSFAEKTTMEMKSEITGGGKYSDDANLKQMRDIFKNQILNDTYEFNSELLEKEDWWFSKPAFRDAFAEYLTANGVKTEQDIKKKPKIVAKAKAYALEQSQIATFRQYSYLANKIGELERKNTAMNIAVGSVLPFKKTPINIAKTGLNYSPLGFAKTLTYDISQMKKGNMEASEVIDHLAQNITGTGLSLVGFMLASMGLASGGGEDDKEGKYDYQLGEQRYALNIGGKSFSLSWLSPVAMPMFVGVNAYEQLVESKEWNGDLVMETLAKTLDPLSEMSFLSSLDDVLSSYDSGVEKFAGIGKSAMQSYVSQFVPTVSSQVATVLDDKKRTTKVGADSGFKMVEETINELKYKIPFLRETLEPSTDIWGNEVKQTENVLARSFETFIAPYSKKDNIATEIDDEIKSVYRETGESEVIPSVPNNYTNFKDEKYKMSAKEYTEYKKTYGQLANELMGDLFDTKTYKKATSEEKAQMIGYVYDYARDEAKKELLDKRGVEYTNATLDGVDYYQENAIKGAIEHDMPVDEYKFYRKNPKKHTFFTKELGITYKKYDNADEKTKDVYNWAFDNQEKYTVSKAIADDVVEYRSYAKALNDIKAGDKTKSFRIDYINSLPIDEGQAIILYRTYYDSKEDKRKYNGKILDYINSRDDLTYEERVTILEELDFTVYSDGRVEW